VSQVSFMGKNESKYDGAWNDAIQLSESKKGIPQIKIGVLGHTNVGKTSLSRKFAKRVDINPNGKNLKTTGIDMFTVFLKVDIAKLVDKEIQ